MRPNNFKCRERCKTEVDIAQSQQRTLEQIQKNGC